MVNNDFKSESTKFITVGIKGRTFLTRTSRELIADFQNNDVIDENLSKQIRQMIVNKFEAEEIGSVSIVFPNFVSTLTQTPHVTPLLPIDPTNFLKFVESVTKKVSESGKHAKDYNIESDLNTVFEYALLHFLDVSIYQALCETKASEHSARMIAMQNATKNAKDLVSDLTLAYNQIRQDAITNELLEISSAQAALN
jgi:F-type H+-transporting ATPase subunit gamma